MGISIIRMRILFWLLLIVSSVAQAAGGAGYTNAAASSDKPQQITITSAMSVLGSLAGWFGKSPSTPDLLPPDQAFQVTVKAQDADTLVATLTPAKDYYLYRSRIKFSVENTPDISIVSVLLPRGEMKDDLTFGDEEVYYRPAQALIKLKRSADSPESVTLRAGFQGCNLPSGVCYPPIEKTLTVALAHSGPPPGGLSEATVIQHLFVQESSWTLIAAFFGFGLVLAFTPCMLPMIPILSGIIVGQGRHVTRRRSFGLSLVYVLAMAVTYALAGVAAGLAGTLLSAYLQSPWVLGGFATIFVLLALSMFGLYELQLPASWQSRLASASNRKTGGEIIGVFLMGVLSAVIVGPCVAAPLAGALLYIGQTQDVALGGVALFSLAIGMGTPLLIFGTAAGALLPRAGAWMTSVQRFFGVMMLAVAIYLISPVIPALVHILLWAALLIGCAMHLSAIDALPTDSPGYRRLGKGIGVMALVAGIALLIGALSGNRDILQPLAGWRSAGAQASAPSGNDEIIFQPLHNIVGLEAQLQAAKGRYAMLDFWAQWCVSCKEMDRFTFTDPQVKRRLKDVVLLRADVTANNADDRALLKRFHLFGPPGMIFFDRQGQEIDFQVIGFQPPKKFLASLNNVLSR